MISRFTYLYDPVGNRLQERREDGDLRVFGYDPTNQLISEQRTEGEGWETLTADQWGGMSLSDWGMLPAGGGAGPITTYVYDPVGNRLVLNADGELTTSTYDAANRLRTAEDLSGITTYTFDANGNQRTVETPTGEITTYSWTYENQLAQLEEPDDVVTTNIYAPTNRKGDELRITKETDVGVRNFIYDDQNLIQEVDETGTVEAEYTLKPQPYGNLVSQRRESESTFYNYDALGSAQSLTDQTGTVENDYTYGAFGNIFAQSGITDNHFTWIGKLGYYQEANGDYLLRQRWYGEQIDRFFSQDPIGFDAGDENFYRYAGNSPVTAVDPSGNEGTIPLCSGMPCTQTGGNQQSNSGQDYNVLKDLFPPKDNELTVAKLDPLKVPKSRVDELLKNKADTMAEELAPIDGRRVVAGIWLRERNPRYVLLVQNIRDELICVNDIGGMSRIPVLEDTFSIIDSYPLSYPKE